MAKVQHGKRIYKQMALEVAVRNPERYGDILKLYSEYVGRVLNDETILDIYAQLLIRGIVTSKKFDASDKTEQNVKDYIKNNLSHNNEWGFPTGYQAAFTRYLKTLSELGFIYSQYEEPLLLSPVANAVVSSTISLSEAFALQSLRFWRKSPYRRVSNDFNYFRFILEVIRRRNEMGKHLSLPQFMLSLFSDDGNVDDFLALLDNNKVGNDLKKAHALAVNLFKPQDKEHQGVADIQTSFRDYGNSVFRALRLTGFVTVDYSGVILLSINTERKALLDDLLALNFQIPENAKEDEKEYFNHLGSFDNAYRLILESHRDEQTRSVLNYNTKLSTIIIKYQFDSKFLMGYLLDVSNGKPDSNVFGFIPDPIKFEFLLTLFMYSVYGEQYTYKPNYICDASGVPYSHAPGNVGDIEMFNRDQYLLIEATLIRNKTQQVNSETINLFRHIDMQKSGAKYMSLVAPVIHPDTSLLIKVATAVTMVENNNLIFSKAYDTKEFVEKNIALAYIDDMQGYTVNFISDLKNHLSKVEAVGADNPNLHLAGNREKLNLLKRLSRAFSSFRKAFKN